MSLALMDLAVSEAIEVHNLSGDHFLADPENIAAAKKMIEGSTKDCNPAKAWLYTIVNDVTSGAIPTPCVVSWRTGDPGIVIASADIQFHGSKQGLLPCL
jgi:hypothetical protein